MIKKQQDIRSLGKTVSNKNDNVGSNENRKNTTSDSEIVYSIAKKVDDTIAEIKKLQKISSVSGSMSNTLEGNWYTIDTRTGQPTGDKYEFRKIEENYYGMYHNGKNGDRVLWTPEIFLASTLTRKTSARGTKCKIKIYILLNFSL